MFEKGCFVSLLLTKIEIIMLVSKKKLLSSTKEPYLWVRGGVTRDYFPCFSCWARTLDSVSGVICKNDAT